MYQKAVPPRNKPKDEKSYFERSRWKYLQRCYRYIYLDAGHIGQNFYLNAEALGLGACTIGAIYYDEINDLLGIDGINETCIYVGAIGKKLMGNP